MRVADDTDERRGGSEGEVSPGVRGDETGHESERGSSGPDRTTRPAVLLTILCRDAHPASIFPTQGSSRPDAFAAVSSARAACISMRIRVRYLTSCD